MDLIAAAAVVQGAARWPLRSLHVSLARAADARACLAALPVSLQVRGLLVALKSPRHSCKKAVSLPRLTAVLCPAPCASAA